MAAVHEGDYCNIGSSAIVRGTTEWEELAAPVRVEGTRLLEVRVVRAASGRFDNKLRGTVWIDEVRLERR